MAKYTYELNNCRKDADFIDGKITRTSPVVEVFSAMVNGESLEKFGKRADPAVRYIKDLGTRADNGDTIAAVELNTIRKFAIEAPVMEEIKLLSIFGSYQQVGLDESIERETYRHVGEFSRVQAAGGDVVFPGVEKIKYPVGTEVVSGGYAVDYRRVSLGDMSNENKGLALVKTDILNRATALVVNKVYEAIKNASGVKYTAETAGLTKGAADSVINKVRRYGRPTVLGDYALLAQFSSFAGFVGNIATNTITGISEKAMNEIAQNGYLAMYNGALLKEISNPYNEYLLNDAGDDFQTMLPIGLGFVIPAGIQSPIATYTRGGLTTCQGTNVKTGKLETRFDLEIGADVAKTQEHKIGVIYDTDLGGLD